MKTKFILKLKSIFIYCGLTEDQYNMIRSTIYQKNERVLYVASLSTVVLGMILFAANVASSSLAIYPCLFMIVCGGLVFATKFIPHKKQGTVMALCYTMLVLLFTASAATSFLPSNITIPSTTFVAFLALLPLLIEDSPIRMAGLQIASGIIYISLSSVFKVSAAFKLDVINTITFLVIGILFYAVISRRTVLELWRNKQIKDMQNDIIVTLGTVIEARDGVTGEHVTRTQRTLFLLTSEMKRRPEYKHLSPKFFEDVCKAAALHDVGKIQTPDAILMKRGRLTPDEFEVIKKHPLQGADIVSRVTTNTTDKQFFSIVYNIVKYHHERWDGTGYPCGLKGEEIPLEARIMAIADVYDALMSLRPYKPAFPKEDSVRLIKEGRGTQFDPILTDIFLSVIDKDVD